MTRASRQRPGDDSSLEGRAQLGVIALALLLAGCSTNLEVDPAGYRCDPGGVCPGGYECVSDACQRTGANLCTNVTCTKASECSGDSVKVFSSACEPRSGMCNFTPAETPCMYGCANGVCNFACVGTTCSMPPPATCMGGTLRAFAANGTCNAITGACAYTPVDTVCTSSCMQALDGGISNCIGQDVCAGVTCMTPPAASCDGLTARTFARAGTCSAGSCSYAETRTTCASACSAGICADSPSLTFKQIGPRLKFPISAIDIAPNSNGSLVVAAGDDGHIARWNGIEWSMLTAPSTEHINAIHFVSNSTAWLAGSKRALWTYRSGMVTAAANPPGTPGSQFVSVFGRGDANVLLADAVGNWHKWSGSSWVSGALPSTKGPYVMRSAFIDETNRERLGGRCGPGINQTCVAYRDPENATTEWAIDNVIGADSSGCNALGPFVDAPTQVSGPDVLCGKPTNELKRHTQFGFSVLSAPVLPLGNGVVGITGGPARSVFALTSSDDALATGALYRLIRSGTGVPVEQLLTTRSGEEHLSANESSGVVVAEVRRTEKVNNVFHRGPSTTTALDMGEDWEAITTGAEDELVLISGSGDVATQKPGSNVFGFARGPGNLVVRAAAAQRGTGVLIVGADPATNLGFIARSTPGAGLITIATDTFATEFTDVCRVSDSEAYVVGSDGEIFIVNSLSLTATSMISGIYDDLKAVDCGPAGSAIAVGVKGVVLRLTGRTWAAVTPKYPRATEVLKSVRLINGVMWVLGESTFSRLDPAATEWVVLPPQVAAKGLFIRSSNEVYSVKTIATASEIVRFDGTAWRSAMAVDGVLRGGVQTSAKVLLGGARGLLVEGTQ